jgi:hypothetical protein
MTGRQPPSTGSTSHGAGALHSCRQTMDSNPTAACYPDPDKAPPATPQARSAAQTPVPAQKGTSPRPPTDGRRRRRLMAPPCPDLLVAAPLPAGAQTEGDLRGIATALGQVQAPLPPPRQGPLASCCCLRFPSISQLGFMPPGPSLLLIDSLFGSFLCA